MYENEGRRMWEKERRLSNTCLMDSATRRVRRDEPATVAADRTLIQLSGEEKKRAL